MTRLRAFPLTLALPFVLTATGGCEDTGEDGAGGTETDGADSSGGDGDNPGITTTGGSGTSDGSGGASSYTSGASGDSSGDSGPPPGTSCDECLYGYCGQELEACLADTGCACWLDCTTAGRDDAACMAECGDITAPLLSLLTCFTGPCGEACADAGGTGGDSYGTGGTGDTMGSGTGEGTAGTGGGDTGSGTGGTGDMGTTGGGSGTTGQGTGTTG